MQTAVHFLRVDQFRAFSGSFSQSSSRLSTAFSISSSELGEVGSLYSRGKVRSNEVWSGVSDPTVAFSATWEELEGCLADIGILWLVVPSPLPDMISAGKIRMEAGMRQKKGRKREGKKRLHPICGKYKYRKNARK